jgi:uncharacterized protein
MQIIKVLSVEFKIPEKYVENTVQLIDEGNTIPFIARYRKEATGALDDQVLRELADRLTYLRNLDKRKSEVAASIEDTGNMTDEIRVDLENAQTLAEVEDIYRPYKPKRKTRASVAREKGLEPFAACILMQDNTFDPYTKAVEFINEEKGVLSIEDAIAGASDIIAEMVSDNAALRKKLREYLMQHAILQTISDKDEPTVYSMYYDFSEAVSKIAGHRVLAIDRGEREGILKVKLNADEAIMHQKVLANYEKGKNKSAEIVHSAALDGFGRLILPSLEREIRSSLSEYAAEQAIKVFALNLKPLLLQPPIKNRVTLGLDPAYRTGCKIAVVDGTGKVLHTTVVYPTPPQQKIAEAEEALIKLINKYGVSIISIGNGTASRESEEFVASLIKKLNVPVSYMVVSEAGASVYSASKLAAEEFPEFDVSLRSAVSIARRLQDPLAELVKIDPKAIGVGQYQHDMPKNRLDEALNGVVENCVNTVGVDVNTASFSLLSHVAGVNTQIAKNIVAYREQNGSYKNRKELNNVSKLGKKAFEQCAGFLRVPESDNILDNTSVHPESYTAANKLLAVCGYSLEDLKVAGIIGLKEKVKAYGENKLAHELSIGVPTLHDIIDELLKPGRDIRDNLPPPLLRTNALNLEDLKPGMALTGTVRNVIDFGVFVDIGVHDDGLVHISQICDRYIKHPSEVLKVGDIVNVKVLEVDTKRKRISLTMKNI